MEYVSQKEFTENEFTKWREDTMTSGIMIPSMEVTQNIFSIIYKLLFIE